MCVCVCVCVCVLFSQCPTLCNPIDCSPPGPSIHGILQARTLEWVVISLSKRNYRKKESEVTQSYPSLCNPMDCSLQAPPSMEFSRQEYQSGLPFPSPVMPNGTGEIRVMKNLRERMNCLWCHEVVAFEMNLEKYVRSGIALIR